MSAEEDPVVAALGNYRLRCPEDCGLADEALAVYDVRRKALETIRDYFESVYAPGDQAYQAAIVARAALAKEDADD